MMTAMEVELNNQLIIRNREKDDDESIARYLNNEYTEYPVDRTAMNHLVFNHHDAQYVVCIPSSSSCESKRITWDDLPKEIIHTILDWCLTHGFSIDPFFNYAILFHVCITWRMLLPELYRPVRSELNHDKLLMYACKYGYIWMVRALLNANNDTAYNRKFNTLITLDINRSCYIDLNKYNSIYQASRSGFSRILDLLLRDARLETLQAITSVFREACQEGSIESVSLLLPHLLRAYSSGDNDLHKDVIWDALDRGLWRACIYGHLEIVQLLLLPNKDRAIKEEQDDGKDAQLMDRLRSPTILEDMAIHTFRMAQTHPSLPPDCNILKVLDFLLNMLEKDGAFMQHFPVFFPPLVITDNLDDIELRYKEYQDNYINLVNVILKYPDANPGLDNDLAIRIACENQYATKVVKRLLQDSRVNPGASENAALMYAIRYYHHETVKLLLDDSRVDPNANHLLSTVCVSTSPALVSLILLHPRVDPSVYDNEAILQAVHHRRTECLKLLVNHPKVDPAARDNACIKIACLWGSTSMVKTLLETGKVDPSDSDNRALINACCYRNIYKQPFIPDDVPPITATELFEEYADNYNDNNDDDYNLYESDDDTSNELTNTKEEQLPKITDSRMKLVRMLLDHPKVKSTIRPNSAVHFAIGARYRRIMLHFLGLKELLDPTPMQLDDMIQQFTKEQQSPLLIYCLKEYKVTQNNT